MLLRYMLEKEKFLSKYRGTYLEKDGAIRARVHIQGLGSIRGYYYLVLRYEGSVEDEEFVTPPFLVSCNPLTRRRITFDLSAQMLVAKKTDTVLTIEATRYLEDYENFVVKWSPMCSKFGKRLTKYRWFSAYQQGHITWSDELDGERLAKGCILYNNGDPVYSKTVRKKWNLGIRVYRSIDL